jgi:phage shock protein A
MALLDRVATLVKANLNDLVDRAEHPEKMLKQVAIDMENQFMQVKTQAAIALADTHLLERKKKESAEKHAEWMRKAELAVDKKDDELARAALERAMSFQQLTENFEQQLADQRAQVESLKSALKRLEMKMTEAHALADVLLARHRRARSANQAADAQQAPANGQRTFERMKAKVSREEVLAGAKNELAAADLEGRLEALDREDKISILLEDLKSKKRLGA